jgi:hypothetical protein
MAKYNEASLEDTFIALLQEQDISYAHGSAIRTAQGVEEDLEKYGHKVSEEVLIRKDLKAYLAKKYQSEDITPAEIDRIIRDMKNLPASDLYSSNQAIMKKVSVGFACRQKPNVPVCAVGFLYVAQQSYNATELSKIVNQNKEQGLRSWLGRLLEYELVVQSGKGTQYAVNPEFIRQAQFKGKTSLKNIEDHRLEELIYKDIKAYPESAFGDIHNRIGKEINEHKVRRTIKSMVENGSLRSAGERRWTRYSIEQNLRENQ